MSLLYNRDRNITGLETLTGFSFNPSYGSSVSFGTRNSVYSFGGNKSSTAPIGINNVAAKYSLVLPLRKDDAQSLIDFAESLSGTGFFAFNDASQIYQEQSGVLESFSWEAQAKDKYLVNLEFTVDRNSSALNWSGQSFVDFDFVKWEAGQDVSDYDVRYFEHDLQNPEKNFFYCTGGAHTTATSNHPLSTGSKWTNNLFLDPNLGFGVQTSPNVAKNEFSESFVERVKAQSNIHKISEQSFSYERLSDKQTKALLHFLETRQGHKRFKYTLPEIYNRPKLFYAPSWRHTWNYKDSHNVELTLTEDSFGLVASGSPQIKFVQESGNNSLVFSITGFDPLFMDTGDGKAYGVDQGLNTVNWSNTGQRNAVKLFGRYSDFSALNQNLVKLDFSRAKELTGLYVASNSLSVLNLYDAPNLVRLEADGNSIGGFDFYGMENLQYASISGNGATYLNLSGANNLTGLLAQDNSLSGVNVYRPIVDLKDFGLYSGFLNVSGNGDIGLTGFNNVAVLTGRDWTVGYVYNPLPTITTTEEPSVTLAPVNGYVYSVAYDNNDDPCNPSDVGPYDVMGNADSFTGVTKVYFEGVSIIEGGPSLFWLENGGEWAKFEKVCCNIGSILESGVCTTQPPATPPPTTPPPTTVVTTTATTYVPPTTIPP